MRVRGPHEGRSWATSVVPKSRASHSDTGKLIQIYLVCYNTIAHPRVKQTNRGPMVTTSQHQCGADHAEGEAQWDAHNLPGISVWNVHASVTTTAVKRKNWQGKKLHTVLF